MLHSKPDAGSSGSNGGQAGADVDALSTQGSSSVPRWYVTWWQKASKAATDQQQQQLSQQQSLELVEELLNICVVFDVGQLCQRVAALPAAQQIGEQALWFLTAMLAVLCKHCTCACGHQATISIRAGMQQLLSAAYSLWLQPYLCAVLRCAAQVPARWLSCCSQPSCG
jgi:hypothetical protein